MSLTGTQVGERSRRNPLQTCHPELREAERSGAKDLVLSPRDPSTGYVYLRMTIQDRFINGIEYENQVANMESHMSVRPAAQQPHPIVQKIDWDAVQQEA